MKLVIAVVAQDKLDAVREALPEPDAYVFYVNLVGDVREPIRSSYRGGHYTGPRPRLRVEIVVVNEMLLDEVVGAVVGAAASDSGGNIFVLPLEDWVGIPANTSARRENVLGQIPLPRGEGGPRQRAR